MLCRVWSVRHSKAQAGLGMSTSDDGTARIWSGCGPHTPVAVIKPSTTASICDGAFCDYDRNLIGLASANHNAYVYDMRRLDAPLHVLTGHSRAVSYVRFLSGQRLVTASVDGSLACWDLPFQTEDAGDQVVPDWDGNFSGTAYLRKADQAQSWRHFRGHHNSKNFVGLTVRPEDGLMATGSETSTVFAYNTHWTMPLAQQDLAASVSSQWMDPLPDLPDEGEFSSALPLPTRQKQFVSAVNFMPRACQANLPFEGGPILAAAMSTGAVKLLTLNLLEEQKPSLSQNSSVQD